MAEELKNFILVWISVIISLHYCFLIGKIAPKGIPRLIPLTPIITLFLFLPLNLTTVHLGGPTAFFIAWLANFKLLLFAFGKGPLSDSSNSLPRFIAIAGFPIKIQPNPDNFPEKNFPGRVTENFRKFFIFGFKVLVIEILMPIYDYKEFINPNLVILIYCLHIYFLLDIIITGVGAVAKTLIGAELEPQFNDPFLTTSLQDFWGRRWNLMVTNILRQTVYDPLLAAGRPVVGRSWAAAMAIMATFVVSGLMHELIFYYLGRVKPTWEVTSYFLIQGFSLIIEVIVKKMVAGKVKLPWWVSGILTGAFVIVTGVWLFFPPFLRFRAVVRAVEESEALVEFLKHFYGIIFNFFGKT